MNLTETVKLLAIVQAATPGMRMTEITPEVWQALLADVPYADAEGAVYRHTKTSSGYLAPADIRRRIAQDAGLLPPDVTEALRFAQSWASSPNVVLADAPHPVVAKVCQQVRASFISEQATYVWHKVFREAYAAHSAECERDVLAGDLGVRLHLRSVALGELGAA